MICYGYGITDGKITVIEKEAEIVRRIFREYQQGRQLQEIADRLNEEGVVFYLDNCCWNKNKVFRIIENKKYIGMNEYPVIIEEEEFYHVNREKAKRGNKKITLSAEVEYLKTLDEDKLQKAICRALKTAIQDRKEVTDLIVSNLSYALTGENDVLDSYAIERQMETIKQEIDDSIELLEKTEGDKGRIEKMIEQQTNTLVVLREQASLVKAKIENNEVVNAEVERIKSLLTGEALCFDIYDDRTVRLLVEYI